MVYLCPNIQQPKPLKVGKTRLFVRKSHKKRAYARKNDHS